MEPEKFNKFHLIEVNLISAQELKKVGMGTKMQTYAVTWIDPESKLTSRIDTIGHENPTWNDKFVFAINGETLGNMNSALVIEIYCVRYFCMDKLVGTVRILLDNLIGGSNRYYEGIRGTFMAFQVRRPSGEPQGILNIGVIILDGVSHKVMNEIVGLKSPIGYRELMGRTNDVAKKGGCFPKIVQDL
ncbi:hypothetical protein HHK36_000680 [Tetracentron sinense]|uniref:C2 domain-containing protein n=1 Tax=Tetracentron sinense TaxID=13715 RepID=A0A835DQY5_TETSI|nr:hypothetical protein HHK36_000680 [Tetracentron sinense]